ncbi:MAG: metalloregulator ArsR/SmtB family transcription factor [Gemmatimonadetes bacterium]|nr:metalloregulator ArsR/SmtB family transcription factor [Gemmatimonadota bacterium]
MDEQLKALSDPTRIAILRALLRGEAQAGDIAAAFPVSRPAISHHLRVLSEAGLIRMRRSAQSRLYSIDAEAIMRLRSQFDRLWHDALPRLKTAVESDQRSGRRRKPR